MQRCVGHIIQPPGQRQAPTPRTSTILHAAKAAAAQEDEGEYADGEFESDPGGFENYDGEDDKHTARKAHGSR